MHWISGRMVGIPLLRQQWDPADGYVHDIHDAHWQHVSDNPWNCLSDQDPRKCTYTAWFATPATTHHLCRTLFRLDLSHKRSKMGCHKVRKDVGCSERISRELCFCNLCQIGQPGDEYHLVFACQALQGVRDNYPDLSGEHGEVSTGQACMGLPNLSQNALKCVQRLALWRAIHLITPRWLEDM